MIRKLLPFITFERENFSLELTKIFCETYGEMYTKDLLLSDNALLKACRGYAVRA